MDFLEEYDVYGFDWDYSPAYDARNLALGVMHGIVWAAQEERLGASRRDGQGELSQTRWLNFRSLLASR